jgi:hypothetical protein
MRINGRTWPAWACAAATIWFVAITVFWATQPLVDRVPTTVTAVPVVNQPPPAVGARSQGPTITIHCGTPSESNVTDTAKNLVRLVSLVDKNGRPLNDPAFARPPCEGFHHQSRLLWFADTGLYALMLAGLAVVMVRRRRHHPHREALAAAAAA